MDNGTHYAFKIRKEYANQLISLRRDYLKNNDAEGFFNNEFIANFFDSFERVVKKYETKAQPKA